MRRLFWGIGAGLLVLSCASGPPVPALRWVTQNPAEKTDFSQVPVVPFRNTPDRISSSVFEPDGRSKILKPLALILPSVVKTVPTEATAKTLTAGPKASPSAQAPLYRLAKTTPPKPQLKPGEKPVAGQGKEPEKPKDPPKPPLPDKTDQSLLTHKTPKPLVVQDRPAVPTPVQSERTLTSRVGEEVFLQFNSLGWLLLDTGNDLQKLGFSAPKYEKQTTSFVFKPKQTGTWQLEFQRQDNVQGQWETQKVKLTVLPKNEVLPVNRPKTDLVPESSAPGLGQNFADAEAQERAGNLDAALKLYLANYSPDNSLLNLKIGTLLAAKGQNSEALKYLERNLGGNSPQLGESQEKALGLLLKTSDPDRLLRILVAGGQKGLRPTEARMLEIADFLQKNNRDDEALKLLANQPLWYDKPEKTDVWLYLTAAILEKPGARRDIKKSFDLYNELLEKYPLSPYWSLAGERANYLNRHYFQLR